jgi:peptide/nickel transport system permease protein
MWAGLQRFSRNRGSLAGAVVLLAVLALALSANLITPAAPLRIVAPPELWPGENPRYLLGTDSVGHNMLALILYGARATLIVGLSASLAATLIGTTVGALAGYFGGRVDLALTKFTELFQTIPNLVFILTIVVILGPKLSHTVFAIAVVSWTPVARLARAEFLSLRDREFVQACRAMDMPNWRIIIGEILPNALPPIVVLASLTVASAILFEAALSFLGLGDPDVASWGRLVGEGKELIRTSWYISAIPGAAIMLTVLALNLVGDGLNDALNPKLRDR